MKIIIIFPLTLMTERYDGWEKINIFTTLDYGTWNLLYLVLPVSDTYIRTVQACDITSTRRYNSTTYTS